MNTPGNRRLRLNRLVAALGGAMALVICGCVGVIIWIVSVSSASLDDTQRAGETRLLLSVRDDYARNLAKAVADYTAWNELYEYFEKPRPQPDWERKNLGPYVTATFDIDRVVVVARSGAIVYSFPRLAEAATAAKSRKVLSQLADLAFAAQKRDSQVGVSGIIEMDGAPSLAAASTIRMSSLDSPSHFALIELRAFSKAFLQKLGRNFGIADLHAERAAPRGLELLGPTGAPSPFDLAWKPSDTGRQHFDRILPAVIIVGAGALLALLGLALLWWRVTEHVRVSEARAEIAASLVRVQAAEETSRSKSDFIANMSHELRTPLNAIIGFSEMITTETFGPIGVAKYREYVGAIYDSGRHLLRIVNDILQISKIEAGKFEPLVERIAVGDVIRDSVRILEGLALKRAIRIEVALEPAPCDALADRQALQQILINIVSNAIKFSPENATVDVGCTSLPHDHVLWVKDRGCGIPNVTLRDLGKPFVQAEGVYSRKYQGTGLGLTISFLLANAMGASIDIESAEGAGTEVRIRLPKAETAAVAPRLTEAA